MVRGMAAVTATVGIVTSTVLGGSSASVSEFIAHDSDIRTTDGSVTAVNSEATFDVSWEGADDGGMISAVLTVENADSGESAVIFELTDDFATTNGTRTYESEPQELLSTQAFEATDFEAAENEIKETEIRYELTVTVETGSETLLVTATDTAIVSVEHVADPRIESVEVTDDSNPQWDRAEISWTVSDPGGELLEVRTELRPEGDTETLDSETTAVDGSDASGEHVLRSDAGGPYEVVITVSNASGNADTDLKPFGTAEELEDGDIGFETVTAEVTDSRGSNSAPSGVTFQYAVDSAEPHTIQFTLNVDGRVESEIVEEATEGTITVEVGGGQPPNTDTATVIADIDGGEQCSREITAADGEVELCE